MQFITLTFTVAKENIPYFSANSSRCLWKPRDITSSILSSLSIFHKIFWRYSSALASAFCLFPSRIFSFSCPSPLILFSMISIYSFICSLKSRYLSLHPSISSLSTSQASCSCSMALRSYWIYLMSWVILLGLFLGVGCYYYAKEVVKLIQLGIP